MPKFFFFFVLLTACCSAMAGSPESAPPPTLEQVVDGFNRENKHIHIDLKNHWLDFDAKVCLRDAPMLEVLVCSPMTREHESIMVSEAKPSQIHLGLLLLGLEPGFPRHVRWVGPKGDQPLVVPAEGPEVEVFLLFKTKVKVDGKEIEKEVEMPANTWLIDAKTRKTSVNDQWLFTGSRMIKSIDGNQTYMADGEGNIISLVHFGDETLAPHNNKTKENNSAGENLVCNTPKIPPEETPVVVRIKPVAKKVAPKAKVEKSKEQSR